MTNSASKPPSNHHATISTLCSSVAPKRRLLGLDLGSKTIGLAVSDGTFMVASPLLTLKRNKFTKDAAELVQICANENIGGLVYGLPINMDGSSGQRVQSTKQFARNFETVHPLPYTFWDERMSSLQVNRLLVDEMDLSRKKRANLVDKLAATIILQSAIDSISNL